MNERATILSSSWVGLAVGLLSMTAAVQCIKYFFVIFENHFTRVLEGEWVSFDTLCICSVCGHVDVRVRVCMSDVRLCLDQFSGRRNTENAQRCGCVLFVRVCERGAEASATNERV